MNGQIIKELQYSRELITAEMRELQDRISIEADRLKKIDSVLENLKELFPQLFEDSIPVASKELSIETKPVWDYKLPFRRRVKELVMSMGRFVKVSELAKIVSDKEPFSEETEEDWQKKISAALTSLKAMPKEGIVKKQIHPGATGWAWGYKGWGSEDERAALEKHHVLTYSEDVIKNRELFEQQR